MNERRPLTPDELAHAVSLLLACIWSEPELSAWGAQHADTFAGIAESHPHHYAAARAAYARRLQQLRGDQRD